MREGTGVESVKDGDRKQVGFKCGTTVSRQREDTRPGGNIWRGRSASIPQNSVNRAGKERLVVKSPRWRRHMKDVDKMALRYL
jgi:hypothetical protein